MFHNKSTNSTPSSVYELVYSIREYPERCARLKEQTCSEFTLNTTQYCKFVTLHRGLLFKEIFWEKKWRLIIKNQHSFTFYKDEPGTTTWFQQKIKAKLLLKRYSLIRSSTYFGKTLTYYYLLYKFFY
jgi:hypothetical protein